MGQHRRVYWELLGKTRISRRAVAKPPTKKEIRAAPPARGERQKMSDIRERLKKLYALALRGVGGEKEQAEAILKKLIKKYGVSMEEIDEDVIKEFKINYSGAAERKILMQIVYKVTNETGRTYGFVYKKSGRDCRTILGVSCTEAQKIEIEFLFDFYKKLYKKELEALLLAFIHKHELFGRLKEGEQGAQLSLEEEAKLYAMMGVLSNESPLLQIEGKKE